MLQRQTIVLTGTSPASASTAITATSKGVIAADWFQIDASLLGATGGALDVFLQRLVYVDGSAVETWVDWVHFPQLSAGASAVVYSVGTNPLTSITAVGVGDATTATPTLAANVCVGGHPGAAVRLVCKAGAGTSAGAVQTVYVTAYTKVA